MNKHLSGVVVAALATALLFTAPALADHRPGNVVVMGGTLALTGHYAVPAKRHLNARKLYVDELNARGGLLGHKVELKIYDDKSDKRPAIELYEKLIAEDKVDLVLGPYASYLNDAVANVMERYKRPFFAHGSNPVMWQRSRKYIFAVPKTFAPERRKGALHLAKQIGVKRVALISAAGPAKLRSLVGTQEWARKLGLTVVLSERYPKEQKDFADLLQRIKASGAEAIFSIGDYPDTVAQIRQLRALNIDVKLFSSSIAPALPKFVEELGSAAEYVVGFAPWMPRVVLGHPGIKEFVEKYERRYGVKPNYHAAQAHAEMQIIEAAVNRAGSFDHEKIREMLATIGVYTVRGHFKANARGVSPSTEGVTIQIQNGKRVIVWPEHLAEARVLLMPKWEDRAKK